MDLIGILVTLIILAIIAYAVYIVIGMFALPQPIKQLVYLLTGVILLVFLLNQLGIYHVAL